MVYGFVYAGFRAVTDSTCSNDGGTRVQVGRYHISIEWAELKLVQVTNDKISECLSTSGQNGRTSNERLKSLQLGCWFNSLFGLIRKEIAKLRITGPFVKGIQKSPGVPLTKAPVMQKALSFPCYVWSSKVGITAWGCVFKNAYDPLNLRTLLKILMLYKNHILQCMGKILWVEFQISKGIIIHALKDVDFIQRWKFKSS